jgi:hypothetical protein
MQHKAAEGPDLQEAAQGRDRPLLCWSSSLVPRTAAPPAATSVTTIKGAPLRRAGRGRRETRERVKSRKERGRKGEERKKKDGSFASRLCRLLLLPS